MLTFEYTAKRSLVSGITLNQTITFTPDIVDLKPKHKTAGRVHKARWSGNNFPVVHYDSTLWTIVSDDADNDGNDYESQSAPHWRMFLESVKHLEEFMVSGLPNTQGQVPVTLNQFGYSEQKTTSYPLRFKYTFVIQVIQ